MAQRGGPSGGAMSTNGDNVSEAAGGLSAPPYSTTAPGAPAHPAYEPILSGARSQNNTFLKRKVFVLHASFPEVHHDRLRARAILEQMLKAFGATVNKKLSRNTCKYSSTSICFHPA